MKIRLFVTAALVLLAWGVWMKNHGFAKSGDGAAVRSRTKNRDSESISDREASGVFRTKVANREMAGPRATHSPERLKEFMLPEVLIDGLTLGEALQKLMGVYEETCGKTGETPLRLTFDLPPGNAKKLKLKLKLSPRNFNSSVQLLATYSRMKVSRNKTAYHFEPFPDDRKHVSLAIQVPPDFASRLIEQAGIPSGTCFESLKNDPFVEATPVRLPIGEIIKASGLDLDPSTQLSLSSSGSLKLETSNRTDAAMISALTDTLSSEKPIQHKFTSQVLEIPAGSNWTPPDTSQMTEDQVQSLMHEIAVTQGSEMTTLPSVTGKSGQQAVMEIVRELIVPTDDAGTPFEKHDMGKVLNITGDSLGFGHESTIQYTDTVGGLDDTGKKIVVNKRTDLATSGYSSDGGSRLVTQTNPDGSKTLLIVTSQLIDATGRPLHGGE